MPPDRVREGHIMHSLIDAAGGSDDLSPTEGWGAVPEGDRPLWSRYMLDYMPWFPGVTMMTFVAPGVLNGGTGAPLRWKRLAQRLHAVGFTPTDYYLLCQDLDVRRERGRLTEEAHGRFFDVWGRGRFWGFEPRTELWAPWPAHVRAGRSPRRATDYVLSDGTPSPLGHHIAPQGTIGAPIGD